MEIAKKRTNRNDLSEITYLNRDHDGKSKCGLRAELLQIHFYFGLSKL